MCLYNSLVKNPKYKPNKKNGGQAPPVWDTRVLSVPIGCGDCMECRKKKANEWRTRLSEEVRSNPKRAYFITLTFDDKNLEKLKRLEADQDVVDKNINENSLCYIAIRLWTERIRKFTKKGLRYWLITEKGQCFTHRIHMHGIVWADEREYELMLEKWDFGIKNVGYAVNERAINYLVKYMLKPDLINKDFRSRIFCSHGIGASYVKRTDAKRNKFTWKTGKTIESYRLKNGLETALPIYYRNKIYTEDEREILWIEKLEKNERFVDGVRVDVSTDEGMKLYEELVDEAREINKKLGFKIRNLDKIEDRIRKYKRDLEKLNSGDAWE